MVIRSAVPRPRALLTTGKSGRKGELIGRVLKSKEGEAVSKAVMAFDGLQIVHTVQCNAQRQEKLMIDVHFHTALPNLGT